jgi:hypothetical protein
MNEQIGHRYTRMGQRREQHDVVPQQEASRHRVGHQAGLHPEDTPYLTSAVQQRRTVDDEALDDGDYDDEWPPRLPTSARRYQVSPEHVFQQGNQRVHVRYVDVPPRSSRKPPHLPPRHVYTDNRELDESESEGPRGRQRVHVHWSLFLGLGMMVMVLGWIGMSFLGSRWQTHQDDTTYGRPRTSQVDAVVGHNDSRSNPSHFIALNLHRHVVIIELPGGDSSKAKIYSVTTLYGDGQDLTPMTLSFKDVNGDGLLDMEIRIEDQSIALLNENGGFRPLRQGEHLTL